MRKLCLGLVLVMTFCRTAHAIDLSIKDPVVSNLEISVNASLSATSNYYLQGTIRSQSSSKYFGETQNNKGDYIDYISSPEKEYISSNFFFTDVKNATWSGTVKLRFKIDDTNYLGPGLYDLKLRRFTGGSTSSAGDSNILTVSLSAVVPTPSPSPSPSPSPTSTPTPTPSPSPSPIPSPKPSPSPELSPISDATVAGVSTEIDLSSYGSSPTPSLPGVSRKAPSLNRSRLKTVIYIGVGLIILSVASFFGYHRYLRLKGSDL